MQKVRNVIVGLLMVVVCTWGNMSSLPRAEAQSLEIVTYKVHYLPCGSGWQCFDYFQDERVVPPETGCDKINDSTVEILDEDRMWSCGQDGLADSTVEILN